MKKIIEKFKDRHIWIVVVCSLAILVVFLFFEHKITNGNFGVPLDDAFIHFQFARKIADGEGFSYNDNTPTPGSTSPAWTLLISAFYTIWHNPIFIAKVLSAVFYIFSGIFIYLLAEKVLKSKKWAVFAALAAVFTGRFAWAALSGMEVTLFTFLLVTFLYLYLKDFNKYFLVFLLGIASAVRPEGYLFFGFFCLAELYAFSKSGKLLKKNIISLLKSFFLYIIIYLTILTPYFLFTYSTTGRLLTNTFSAQARMGMTFSQRLGSFYRYLRSYLYLLLTDNPAIVLLMPVGFYTLHKRKSAKTLSVLLLTVGFPIGAGILAPNLRHHGRYIMPLIPVYTLIGVLGLKKLLDKMYRRSATVSIKLSVVIILASMAFYTLATTFLWADTFGWNTKNINDIQVKLGYWIEENLPDDALIAVNDIGAIKYYSQNKIIDLIGLVSPDILEITGGDYKGKQAEIWQYVLEREAEYVIIYPCWFPQISKEEKLHEIYRVEPDRYTVIDCEMVVYEIGE